MRQIKDFEDFKSELQTNSSLQEQFKEDPVTAISQIDTVLDSDKWIYRIVVFSMGLAIVIILLGVIILMYIDEINEEKDVPVIFTALGSAALGAMAGLLAPSPRK